MKKVYLLLLSIVLLTGWSTTAFSQITSYPYFEDFDSWTVCVSTSCGAVSCTGQNGWVQDGADDIDWFPYNLATSSSNTGADFDHTTGSGIYLYTENSGCTGAVANLHSPEFDLSNLGNASGVDVTFWRHMFGSDMGTLNLDYRRISNGTPGAWVNLWTLSGNQPASWIQETIGVDSLVGDTIQFRFNAITGTSFRSDISIDDFMVEGIFEFDAGVTAIDTPINPIAAGSLPVYVSVTNFGTDTLYNDSIGWSVNGVVQPSVFFSDTLPRPQTSDPFFVGNYTFSTGFSEICAWNLNPNDTIDQNNGNDTTCFTVCTPFSGTFTIGGTGADWASFQEAADALMQCGIDGPVVLNVSPGVYNENMNLGVIPGASPTNTVTFNGMDTSMVTISAGAGPAIHLVGTDYVTLKNLTIEALGTSDAYGVQLADTAEWNVIDSCWIVMDQSTTNLSDVIGVSASGTVTSSFTEGQNALWTTVSNTTIIGGEKGIHFEGQNANRTIGNRFINNTIMNVEDYGFYIDDQDSLTIEGNTISGVRNSNGDGIYCFDIQMFNISGNSAMNIPDWALYIADGNYGLDGTPTSRGRIVNNMFSSVTDYAMYLDDFEFTDIFHNTAYGNPGIRINDYTNLDIRNNIFQSDNDYAFEADEPPTNTPNVLNYNCYWTPASNGLFVQSGFGVTPANLPAWQTAQAIFNVNSVEGDPVFLNGLNDLHVLGIAPNDVGDSLGVTMDIDGEVRPATGATIVDMGADEYTPRQNDAVLLELLAPGAVQCGDSSSAVWVSIKNQGILPITSLPITINVTGDITTTLNFTYTDTLNFNESDTVEVGTINTYGGARITLDGRVDLVADEDSTNDFLAPFDAEFVPIVPQVINGYGCGTDSALVAGAPWSGASYAFYASPTDTVPVAIGQDFMIPSITTQNTYYVEYADNKDSLETNFAQNNGCSNGNMFDITATNSITITEWVGHLADGAGSNSTVNIYYKVGTYTTAISNSAAWTLLGTATVTSNGIGTPTRVNIGNPLTIPAGATYGIYFEANVRYTNGNSTDSNGDITITTGHGHCSSFSSGIAGRIWNGRVIYGTTACGPDRVPVTAVSGVAAAVNIGGDATLCDTSYTLDAGNPGATFMWSTGEMTQSITVTQSNTYSVAITDSNGCGAVDTATVTLFAPISTDLGPDTLLCDGATATLDAGNPGASYVWAPSGNTAQTETVSVSGDVSVIVTDSNGCTAVDTVSVTAAVTPAAAFSSMATGNGLSWDFTDNSTGTPTSWSWDFGDGTGTSTMQNPSYTYGADGNYTVTLTVTNACGTNTSTNDVLVVGMEEILLGGTVTLYPNPSNGRFAIRFEGVNSDEVKVEFMDLLGHVLEVQQVKTLAGNTVHNFDLTNLSKGIYQVRVSAQGQSAVYKAVIE